MDLTTMFYKETIDLLHYPLPPLLFGEIRKEVHNEGFTKGKHKEVGSHYKTI